MTTSRSELKQHPLTQCIINMGEDSKLSQSEVYQQLNLSYVEMKPQSIEAKHIEDNPLTQAVISRNPHAIDWLFDKVQHPKHTKITKEKYEAAIDYAIDYEDDTLSTQDPVILNKRKTLERLLMFHWNFLDGNNIPENIEKSWDFLGKTHFIRMIEKKNLFYLTLCFAQIQIQHCSSGRDSWSATVPQIGVPYFFQITGRLKNTPNYLIFLNWFCDNAYYAECHLYKTTCSADLQYAIEADNYKLALKLINARVKFPPVIYKLLEKYHAGKIEEKLLLSFFSSLQQKGWKEEHYNYDNAINYSFHLQSWALAVQTKNEQIISSLVRFDTNAKSSELLCALINKYIEGSLPESFVKNVSSLLQTRYRISLDQDIFELIIQSGDSKILMMLQSVSITGDFYTQINLVKSANAGNLALVKILLDKNVPCLEGSGKQSPALDKAAEQAHIEIVKLLLSRGAVCTNKTIKLAGKNKPVDKTTIQQQARTVAYLNTIKHIRDRNYPLAAKACLLSPDEDKYSIANMFVNSEHAEPVANTVVGVHIFKLALTAPSVSERKENIVRPVPSAPPQIVSPGDQKSEKGIEYIVDDQDWDTILSGNRQSFEAVVKASEAIPESKQPTAQRNRDVDELEPGSELVPDVLASISGKVSRIGFFQQSTNINLLKLYQLFTLTEDSELWKEDKQLQQKLHEFCMRKVENLSDIVHVEKPKQLLRS